VTPRGAAGRGAPLGAAGVLARPPQFQRAAAIVLQHSAGIPS